MMNIRDYINLAKHRQGITSEEALSRLLGKPRNYVGRIRAGHLNPLPETMEKLAELAGVDPRLALLDLARWQVKDSPVARLYAEMQTIIERAAKTAAAALLALIVLSPQSHAAPKDEQRALICSDIYIIR